MTVYASIYNQVILYCYISLSQELDYILQWKSQEYYI